MIVFDALNHTYTEDETLLPSVTTILGAEGFYNPKVFTAGSADRGTEVHLLTQQMDEGKKTLNTLMLHPLYSYAEAWDRFRRDTGVEILFCEVMVGGKDLGAAGMVDRFAKIRGAEYILDIKSGQKMPWHAIQLAGYKYLSRRACRRACVYLRPTGKYEFIEHSDRYDEMVWKAALISYRWKKEFMV